MDNLEVEVAAKEVEVDATVEEVEVGEGDASIL